jgi:hypothetical protein
MKRQWEKANYNDLIDLYSAIEKIMKEKTTFKVFRNNPYIFLTIQSEIPINKMVEIIAKNLKGNKNVHILNDNLIFIVYKKSKEDGTIKVEVEYEIATWAESISLVFKVDNLSEKQYILDNLEELLTKDIIITKTNVKKVTYRETK